MIEVDGSLGEGGGQMLRTAVSFSAITGEAVRITNIRAGRENPGLRPQHLKAVEAVGLLCDAEVKGLSVGSREVTFTPRKVKATRLKVDVGTAGSATLVLQALLPPALHAPGEVDIEVVGGTDVSHSPTGDYFREVFLYFLRKIGCDVDVSLMQRGFYPRGGGIVRVRVRPWDYSLHLDLTEPGEFDCVRVFSVATEDLRRREVAERQVNGFLKVVSPNYQTKETGKDYVASASTGTCITAYAQFTNTRVGVSAVGGKMLKAEDVGRMAGEKLLAELASKAPLDSRMGDQILPYLVFSKGKVRVAEVTEHLRTNAEIIGKFGYGLRVDGNAISSGE